MNKRQGTILVVDDNKSILAAVEILLQNVFAKIITISNPNRINRILSDEQVDIILLDMNFGAGINSGNEGLFWLAEIKKQKPSIQVILFTAYADIELAVRGIKEGAADFVVKPWENDKLLESLQSAYRAAKNKKSAGQPAQSVTFSSGKNDMFWGKSEAMQKVRLLIGKVSKTDANILITGENGTGKEMAAREIHRLSSRNKNKMVTVDMGAITETLFESELFGHVKGAFTDAQTDRIGKIEEADDSTLFLDEIGNLSYHLQAKLLTVLQQRYIVRVGSNRHIPVNIRLLSATNKNLDELVKKDLFREDLMYRINTIRIHIPPLRERPDDIVPFAEIFLDKQAKNYNKDNLRFTTAAKDKLKAQPWYGNIRELEHFIEKAVIFCENETIDADDLDIPAVSSGVKENEATTIEEMEHHMIRNSINKHNGNLSLVASELGISRQTLYNKIKRYEL
ncbi:MAG: sigma-54 dependent transcriptional regulator [Tannerella sp.]|jgi:DNA-binding NtrC family response regulator|nr:sigma-54 dependent transcriptional regulator [Tannerella sp.]